MITGYWTLSPPPPTDRAIAWVMPWIWLIPAWAFWIERPGKGTNSDADRVVKAW
jgi:hypothetical protein